MSRPALAPRLDVDLSRSHESGAISGRRPLAVKFSEAAAGLLEPWLSIPAPGGAQR